MEDFAHTHSLRNAEQLALAHLQILLQQEKSLDELGLPNLEQMATIDETQDINVEAERVEAERCIEMLNNDQAALVLSTFRCDRTN